MLRPANSLPPQRLLTPRSGHRNLSLCLGPATRRSGAYRDGTLTRWINTARKQTQLPFVCLRTHHGPSLIGRGNYAFVAETGSLTPP
jgi:hypothetical protein